MAIVYSVDTRIDTTPHRTEGRPGFRSFPSQVFNLAEGGPRPGLEAWARGQPLPPALIERFLAVVCFLRCEKYARPNSIFVCGHLLNVGSSAGLRHTHAVRIPCWRCHSPSPPVSAVGAPDLPCSSFPEIPATVCPERPLPPVPRAGLRRGRHPGLGPHRHGRARCPPSLNPPSCSGLIPVGFCIVCKPKLIFRFIISRRVLLPHVVCNYNVMQ